ncbi:hypothetical protein LINGRAHAP2_LOCUS35655 [Linum grandiflorum]
MSTNAAAFLATCLAVVATVATTARSESPVLYTVTNSANNTPGGARFDTEIGAKFAMQTMYAATRFTWILFNQTDDPTARKNITSISLFVDDTPVEAYCNNKNNEIHVNASYLGKYKGGNVKKEFTGVLYHVMAYTWMWDGEGTAPQGLKSGMAEFVRLKAHYAPRMVGMGPGRTDNWDEGYGVTAMFLDYCNNLKDGVFVAELNGKMKDGYSRGYFRELLGKSVDVLWQDYKSKYLLL